MLVPVSFHQINTLYRQQKCHTYHVEKRFNKTYNSKSQNICVCFFPQKYKKKKQQQHNKTHDLDHALFYKADNVLIAQLSVYVKFE